MSWEQKYQGLSDQEKEQFKRIIGILQSQTFIVRDRFDPKSKGTRLNPDYRFAVHRFDIIQTYLEVSGWDLTVDESYGYCAAHHRFSSHRKVLDKLTTLLIYVLRLIYEEEREKLRLSNHVMTTLGSIYGKLDILQLLEKRLTKTSLHDSLVVLRGYQVIDRFDKQDIHDDSQVIIYPTILHLVPNEMLRLVETQIAETSEEEMSNDVVEEEA